MTDVIPAEAGGERRKAGEERRRRERRMGTGMGLGTGSEMEVRTGMETGWSIIYKLGAVFG